MGVNRAESTAVVPPAPISVPVGSILAYIGPLTLVLPENWVLCDGRLISDSQSPFDGRTIPNLTDNRFLMGVAVSVPPAVPGGRNDWENNGAHGHAGSTSLPNIGGFDSSHCFETRGDECFNHTHRVDIRY